MSWSEDELMGLDLGDKRLNKRCMQILDTLGSKPSESVPTACGSWSETIASYRFFSNENVTPTKVLSPHVAAMKQRAAKEKVILCLQDTTEIDYSSHGAKSGIGPLNSEQHRGFLLHPTIVVTPERLCLGIANVHTWYREKLDCKKKHHEKPIEEKESMRWITSYKTSQDLARELPETQVINISDREGDIYEMFLEYEAAPKAGGCDYIIRSCQNRCVATDEKTDTDKLWEKAGKSPILGHLEFNTPSGRGKKSRRVKQSMQAITTSLQPPQSRRTKGKLPPVTITAVLATEIDPPEGEKPIIWLLLTSLLVSDYTSACQVMDYYLCRWQVELFFKVLKSGCEIEELRLQGESSIQICLHFYLIIAWRVLYITMLGRSAGNLSCEAVFEEHEWKAVYMFVKRKAPPDTPPLLDEAIRLVAGLGGFLNRKGDGYPGHKTVWVGLQRSVDIASAWLAFNEIHL